MTAQPDSSDDPFLTVHVVGPDVLIQGTSEGLRHLAERLLGEAGDDTPGAHIHLDAGLDLDDDSEPLIIERI